jgi:hypothetical protein
MSETDEETHSSRVNLDGCYGQIGISAVAAALRYKGDSKNPAYRPRDREAGAAVSDEDTET